MVTLKKYTERLSKMLTSKVGKECLCCPMSKRYKIGDDHDFIAGISEFCVMCRSFMHVPNGEDCPCDYYGPEAINIAWGNLAQYKEDIIKGNRRIEI